MQTLSEMTRAGWNALRRLRCKFLILLTLGCLGIKEEFPFSHFPMYSSFSSRTFYVFLANDSGEPLATRPAAGISTPTLKKIYENELKKEARRIRVSRSKMTLEQKRLAARRTLEYVRSLPRFRSNPAWAGETVRLMEVKLTQQSRVFYKETELVGELR